MSQPINRNKALGSLQAMLFQTMGDEFWTAAQLATVTETPKKRVEKALDGMFRAGVIGEEYPDAGPAHFYTMLGVSHG